MKGRNATRFLHEFLYPKLVPFPGATMDYSSYLVTTLCVRADKCRRSKIVDTIIIPSAPVRRSNIKNVATW